MVPNASDNDKSSERRGGVEAPLTMPSAETSDASADVIPEYSFTDFLLSVPFGTLVHITEPFIGQTWRPGGGLTPIHVIAPDIELYCDSQECGGTRVFTCIRNTLSRIAENRRQDGFLVYQCRNCRKTEKRYSISVRSDDLKTGYVAKYGEQPPLNIIIAPTMETLVGGDLALMRKGLQAESMGLGIGAYTYYRSVVENQKDTIFEELIKACDRLPSAADTAEDLKKARKEQQFKKAVKAVKHAWPHGLLVDGHNPLALLHDILSEGIHDRGDEECLKDATAIRILLGDLAERIDSVLKEHTELRGAISRVLHRKSQDQESST